MKATLFIGALIAAILGFFTGVKPLYLMATVFFIWAILKMVRASKGFPSEDTGDAQ
jgi:hypothetical protein